MGGLEGRVPSGCPSKILSLWAVCGGFAAAYGPQKEISGRLRLPKPHHRVSSEQADRIPVLVDVDILRRWACPQAGHGHHCAGQRVDKAGPDAGAHLANWKRVARWRALQRWVVAEA